MTLMINTDSTGMINIHTERRKIHEQCAMMNAFKHSDLTIVVNDLDHFDNLKMNI